MQINKSTLNVIYDTPSWIIHIATFFVTLGYGIYHVNVGIYLIGVLALISTISCAMAMIQIVRRDPKAIYYYGIVIFQFFALLITCYYFGIRGLVLVTPFVAGVFFLFPYKNALWLSCVFVMLALVAAFPAIETKLYIRLAVAQTISVFFTIAFSHVVNRQQNLLEREAYYDYLTDVLNRRGFINWLHQELGKIKEQGTDLAFFYIDIDNFKAINDTHGHIIGDELLVAFANRILSALRSGDLIKDNLQVCNFSRLSGDEFALAIADLDSEEAAKNITDRLLKAVDQPFHFGEVRIDLGISIGICFASQCDYEESKIFQYSDIAMYKSKSEGRNKANFFR